MSANAMISSRLRGDLGGRETEQRRGEVDVGEPRILGMEAGAQLEQRADAPLHVDAAARRRDHAGDDLEQRRLAGAVLADDAQRFAGGEVEAHVRKRAESWLGVLKRAAKGYRRDNLSDWAAALTYRSVLCLAPGLLVLVSILGLLGKSTTDKLIANVGDLAPGGVRSVIEQIVHNVQGNPSAGLAGILGLVVAFWSASSYVAAFMRASNAIYEVGEGRPVWKTIPVRLAVTVIMMILLVLSAAIVVFTGPLAEKLGQAIGVGHTAVTVFDVVKWPVLIVIVSLMLAILYYACPNVKQSGVQWISPGGVLAVVIWIVASGLFAITSRTSARTTRRTARSRASSSSSSGSGSPTWRSCSAPNSTPSCSTRALSKVARRKTPTSSPNPAIRASSTTPLQHKPPR